MTVLRSSAETARAIELKQVAVANEDMKQLGVQSNGHGLPASAETTRAIELKQVAVANEDMKQLGVQSNGQGCGLPASAKTARAIKLKQVVIANKDITTWSPVERPWIWTSTHPPKQLAEIARKCLERKPK